MEALEPGLLMMLYEHLFIDGQRPTALALTILMGAQLQWLGNVYDWAWRLRNANLSKDGFKFANADRIPLLNDGFEKHGGRENGGSGTGNNSGTQPGM